MTTSYTNLKWLALLFFLSLLALPTAALRTASAQEVGGVVSASFSVIEPLVIVDTTITPSPSELSDLEAALEPIVGADLTLTTAPVEVISSVTPGSELTIPLPLTGASEGLFTGDISFTLGGLTVETIGGITTATVQFDPVLSIQADASLAGTDEGGLNLNLTDPHLIFVPPDPDVSLLPGGDPTVTEIGASFDLKLSGLPDGTALDVTFAKDTSTLLTEPGTKFLLMADSVGGDIGSLDSDIAFGIRVVKIGITNEDLGDNLIVLEVSKAWFDAKIAEGKRILIAKFDDAGEPIPPPQDVTGTCTSTTDPVVCAATLTGSQGGLSVFFVAAMTLKNSTPVATAAFTPINVAPGEGTFTIVATGTDPDGDPLTIVSVLITPSLTGLDIELRTDPLVKVRFVEDGKVEITGPDPEAILVSLRELGGFAVEDAQTIQVETGGNPNVVLELKLVGLLEVEGLAIMLKVTATDPLGAFSTATATPVFPPAPLVSEAAANGAESEEETGEVPQLSAISQIVFSQASARIISDRETRIHTPDGQVEIIIPRDFLSSDERGKSIELELKNLDPAQVSIVSGSVTHIRAIEVNALVDGKDGSINVGEAATLVIPLSPQDIAMAGGDPSTLTVHQLNPATGAWEPLTTVYRSGSTPPQLEASLQVFQHTAIGIFQSAPPAKRANQPEATPVPNETKILPIPAKKEGSGWSTVAMIVVALATVAAVLLVSLATATLLTRRRKSNGQSRPKGVDQR